MSIKLGKKFQLLISGSAAALPRSYLPSYLENKTINLQPRSRRKCQGFSREKKPEKLRVVVLLYCVSGEIWLALLAVVLLCYAG